MNEHWAHDPDLVERYVRGRMGAEERKALKDHLAACPSCRETVERERLVNEGVRSYGRGLLKARLKRMVGERERRVVPWPHVVSIAAALLIVVGLGITYRWWGEEELVVREEDAAAEVPVPVETEPLAKPEVRVSERTTEESADLPATTSAGTRRALDGAASPSVMPEVQEQKKGFLGDGSEGFQWITGVIVDAPVRRREDADVALMMQKGEARAAGERNKRKGETEGVRDGQEIRILQRPEHEVPRDQQPQLHRATIPTMFRQTGDRLELTLFSDTLGLEGQAFQIRWISPDSLLLIIDGNAVAYRIPVMQAR